MMNPQFCAASLPQPRALTRCLRLLCPVLATLVLIWGQVVAAELKVPDAKAEVAADTAQQRQKFRQAWDAARRGDRASFEAAGPALEDYVLHSYWQYEYYLSRRKIEPAASMQAFLDANAGLAFTPGLRRSWLMALGEQARWAELARYAAGHINSDTRAELACLEARARLELGQGEGPDKAQLLADAQRLWAVGHSQPDACDALFAWLSRQGGITGELAWQRIEAALTEGNLAFARYPGRYLSAAEQAWLDRWLSLHKSGYRQLQQAGKWPQSGVPSRIAAFSLKRLARSDVELALQLFDPLATHFDWTETQQGEIARELALMAAVALDSRAREFVARVPLAQRDRQLLEWQVRVALAQRDWPGVLQSFAELPPEAAADERWRYWQARALRSRGQEPDAEPVLQDLAARANYYGFLAADLLDLPYTICPREPEVPGPAIDELATQADFARALELRAVGLDDWARAEWGLAEGRLPEERKIEAAALAQRVAWPDRAIFALSGGDNLRYYDWRFPLVWEDKVIQEAGRQSLDVAWVLGLMRSESAMQESARSGAGALGLMQVMPNTARQISRQQGLAYQNERELLDGPTNIRFGTVYLRGLMDDFEQNPVLVTGAYNAGPNAVKRWLDDRAREDASLWIETLPYFETRDYIPRVLTFATIYDWRLGNPVRRISARMPGLESGSGPAQAIAPVVCRPAGAELALQGQ